MTLHHAIAISTSKTLSEHLINKHMYYVLLVLKPEYLEISRPIILLLMPWSFASSIIALTMQNEWPFVFREEGPN